MRAILLALVVLGWTAPVAAESRWLKVGIGAGHAADLFSTEYALAANPDARESNPLLKHRSLRVSIMTAGTAFQIWQVERMSKKHPKAARVIGIISAAVPAVIAVRNVRAAH